MQSSQEVKPSLGKIGSLTPGCGAGESSVGAAAEAPAQGERSIMSMHFHLQRLDSSEPLGPWKPFLLFIRVGAGGKSGFLFIPYWCTNTEQKQTQTVSTNAELCV